MFNSGVFVDVDLAQDLTSSKCEGSDFETAIHLAGFGKFQRILLGVCGVVYATCAISSTSLSFVLPSAECDFSLTSVDKGKLSAMPLAGMLFGCCLWGSVADSRGRRIAIISSLVLDFLAGLTSTFVRDFKLFLMCRFFNGFGIIGATSIIFSYLGEFLSLKDRDRILGKLEIFWNVGVILLPGVGWALLGKKTIEIIEDGGGFSPWRTFVLICSLPSLISAILLCFLPETPKFYIAKRKFREARSVLQRIYAMNTKNDIKTYPVQSLEEEDNNNTVTDELTDRKKNRVTVMLRDTWNMIRSLNGHHYLKYLAITCFADFGLMASYYTLMMWFPEIFKRFNEMGPDRSSDALGLCAISQPHKDPEDYTECSIFIENGVFLETLLIGISCVPTSVSLSFFMFKFGKKGVLTIGLVSSGVTTLALNWVGNSVEVLVLSCFFEALTSILETVLFCVIVDLFPTNLRALSLTMTATFGRLGAIFGNLIFGTLLDLNCIIPVYLFGLLLIASGLMCLAIPKNDGYIAIQ